MSADARHYLPIGERSCSPAACRSATSDPVGRRPDATCRSRRSISSAARRASAAGGATRSARSAGRGCRSAATACSRSARSCARRCAASSAACCSSTPATSGPSRWAFDLGDLRYAVGPGLRYQTPIGPIRFDVGYQLNPIPDLLVNGEPADAPLAHAFQHRPGVLKRPRQGCCEPGWFECESSAASFTLLLLVLHAGGRRDGGGGHRLADRVVQELAARLHRSRGEQVSERARCRSSGSAATCSSASRWRTSACRWTAARSWRSRISASTTTCSQLLTKGLSVDNIRLNRPVIYLRREGDTWSISRWSRSRRQEADREGPQLPIADRRHRHQRRIGGHRRSGRHVGRRRARSASITSTRSCRSSTSRCATRSRSRTCRSAARSRRSR